MNGKSVVGESVTAILHVIVGVLDPEWVVIGWQVRHTVVEPRCTEAIGERNRRGKIKGNTPPLFGR